MKINWFRIQNFRSIVDSGKCYLDSGITVLAGKNESGKSNILRALECFGIEDFKGNSPQDKEEVVNPSVTVSFYFSKKELEYNFEIENDHVDNFELIITRSDKYLANYSGTCFDELAGISLKTESNAKSEILKLVKYISSVTKNTSKIRESNIYFPNYKKIVTDYISSITALLPSFNEQVRQDVSEKILEIDNIIIECEKYFKEINDIKKEISELIPKFIVFDSFDDILPEYVTYEQVNSSKIMNRFCKVANLDPEKLFNENNGQSRKQISDRISAQISGDFSSYYKQDVVKLKINLDGPKLHFFIYDHDEITPFKPEQRSKGLQWFLSFFLTLNAESDENSIILIDEPGLFLHPKAQEDVLAVLEKISAKQQVMFTTHSPYLIDSNRLDRIRLSVKDKNNHTKIENKIHKGADKDTMTPIITAIGLDITKNLTFSPSSNVLLEGMSDYYYLQAMRKYLGDKCAIDSDVQFIPNVGADQIPNMAALLFGWGIDFKVLLDNDAKGSSVAVKLLNDLCVDKNKVVLIGTGKNHSIEDVFTKSDFYRLILKKEIDSTEGPNSKKVKGLDKILLAKNLCSEIHNQKVNIKFEKKTADNFISLFEQLA